MQLAASNNPKAAIGLECRLGQYEAVLMSRTFNDEICEHAGFKQFAAFVNRQQLSGGKRDIDLGKSASWIKLCADAIDECLKLVVADENEYGAVSDGCQLREVRLRNWGDQFNTVQGIGLSKRFAII